MELVSLRTERDGLLELIHALTPNNQALKLCTSSNSTTNTTKRSPKHNSNHHHHQHHHHPNKDTLPLETVQLLEIIPWDDRAKVHTQNVEYVYQWQKYDAKAKVWIDKHDLFANESSSLSLSSTSTTTTNSSNDKVVHGKIVDLTKGYALPTNGNWEWVGTWQIDGVPHFTANDNNHSSLDDDDDRGWIYASNPVYIKSNATDKCFDKAYDDDNNDDEKKKKYVLSKRNSPIIPKRRYRRRIWKRQRVLTSYPGISRTTKHLLHLSAQNAKLSFTVNKLHDQIFEMQNNLMQKEEEMDKTTIGLMEQISIMQRKNDKNTSELSKKSQEINELKRKFVGRSSIGSFMSQVGGVGGSGDDGIIDNPIKSWGSLDSTASQKSISSMFKFSGSIVDASHEVSMKLRGESPIKSRSVSLDKSRKNKKGDDKDEADNDNNYKESSKELVEVKKKEVVPKKSDSKISRTPLISSIEIGDDSEVGDNGTKSMVQEEMPHDDEKSTTQKTATTTITFHKDLPKRKDTDETETIFEDDSVIVTDYVNPEGATAGTTLDDKEKEERKQQQQQQQQQLTGLLGKSPIKVRNVMDPFKNFNRESIMNKVTSTVKDVENNVHNVKHNVQAIAERARSLQKMAGQLPVK